jgi:putative colanic acid biosynthesis glycosyltransferase
MIHIVEINSCNFGSTGNIMLEIAKAAEEKKQSVAVCYPKSRGNSKREQKSDIVIGDRFSRNLHLKLAEISGLNDCFSFFSTLSFLKKLDRFSPEIIHLHNLHNCYINLPLLFRYVKKNKLKVVWTLHDCWSFTGHCPCFDMIGCDKWKTGCYHCPQHREYPQSLIDSSKRMYQLKKKWFTGVENMTLVTPSEWLAGLAKQSFLKDYPIRVINNGIDLEVFKPTPSNFRETYGCGDKKIVLGVAFGWGERKGLDVFLDLAKRLNSERYQIVLVGTDENVDKQLPNTVISIHRTQNQTELAKIYTAADVFVNPTREENYPTVNMEALACGTPVLTFQTGGSPEILDVTCGSVVPKNDVDALYREIIRICETAPYCTEACLKKAKQLDKNEKFQEYIDLYRNLMRQSETVQ